MFFYVNDTKHRKPTPKNYFLFYFCNIVSTAVLVYINQSVVLYILNIIRTYETTENGEKKYNGFFT